MDWARDNTELSDKDLDNVFKYEEKSTTVVRMLAGDEKPNIWSLKGEDEWEEWIQKERPRLDGYSSGLVLILAKRTGERSFASVKKVRSDDWLKHINDQTPGRSNAHRQPTFASVGENRTNPSSNAGPSNMSGRRSVRTLPFLKGTFRLITKNFYVHSSIARVISRADVPVFSSAEIQMKELDGTAYPAYVYNCRTTNAWDMDLALTATYFPHYNLTFAIVFGCPLLLEEDILRRLSFAMAEAAHPLLMPGIFAELERARHIQIVEATVDELEKRIFELDFQPSKMEAMADSESETRNQEKRAAWLDTTYLRNALLSWNTQLAKISQHVEELNGTVFKSTLVEELPPRKRPKIVGTSNRTFRRSSMRSLDEVEMDEGSSDEWVNLTHDDVDEQELNFSRDVTSEFDNGRKQHKPNRDKEETTLEILSEYTKGQLRRVGHKINHRVQGIIDEYDDKIRDCTMRVDGMAMATQWALGETNVEIALATSRDSRHMRSIALVTMVFLPGTFFATLFSMTFFNWSGSGGAMVSSYIWIYVVITAFFTLLTIGIWWYFVVYRQSRHRKHNTDEEMMPLV